MANGVLKPRWGQPLTGIVSLFSFTLIAWVLWYIFSDPRGPVGWFPYPFVMYLAMMILVGLWQHMLLGDWRIKTTVGSTPYRNCLAVFIYPYCVGSLVYLQ